ncbi:MAG: Gfo/Idh/MocA family oxidoreductase [Patescibacteria group bacterium]
MKVALIGIGRWGNVLLGELSKIAEVKYTCDSKSDLAAVFADLEVRAVFIATQTETHFEIASKALKAGKHVFLEKPGTTSSGDLEKLVRLAEANKLKFAVGYEFPHHPAVQKLKELMAGKKIKALRFDWLKWGTFKDDAVKHLLCHEVSIAKYLEIKLKPISCNKIKIISNSDIVETFFDNAESLINRVSPIKQKTVTIIMENVAYIWSNDELFEISGEELKKMELPQTTPVANELNDFLNSETPLCNGEFALDVYEIVEQVEALR